MTEPITRRSLTTPRAAGFAGIGFAVLFGVVFGMLRSAVPAHPADAGTWLTNPARRGDVQTALNLVPFCGIFFLWFMGSVRARIGDAEDRFFATLFMGSGVLFVGLLFVNSAVAGALLNAAAQHGGRPPLDTWLFGRSVTHNLAFAYDLRMAAVFAIVTSVMGLRLGFFHRSIAWIGFVVGLLLLVVVDVAPWMGLVFPGWVLLVSIWMLAVPHDVEADV